MGLNLEASVLDIKRPTHGAEESLVFVTISAANILSIIQMLPHNCLLTPII